MEASQAQQQQADEATLAALVVLLLSGMPLAEMTPPATAILAPLGIPAASVATVLELLVPHLEPDLGQTPASASGWVARTAFPRHAFYLVNAAKRLATDPSSITAERRYFGLHLAAERGRREAAGKVDAQAARYGTVLGWYSRLDGQTTAGCRAMHGNNFSVLTPPIVEGRPAYPGTVHPFCRCKSGAPHTARVREPAKVPAGTVSLSFDPNQPRDWHGRWMRVGSEIKAMFTPRSRFAKDALDPAAEAIASVHAMPHGVPEMEIRPDTNGKLGGAVGGIVRNVDDPGTPVEFLLAGGSSYAGVHTDEFALVHEIGHLIDLTGFRDEHDPPAGLNLDRFYASHGGPLAELVAAAEDTDAVRRIREIQAGLDLNDPRDHKLYALTEYLLRPHEIFARAYAQWIALRSHRQELRDALDFTRRDGGPEQWSDADFTSLAEIIDRIMRERKWLR